MPVDFTLHPRRASAAPEGGERDARDGSWALHPTGAGDPGAQHARVGGDRAGDDRRGSQCCRAAGLHDHVGRRRAPPTLGTTRTTGHRRGCPARPPTSASRRARTVEVSPGRRLGADRPSQGTLSITGGSLALTDTTESSPPPSPSPSPAARWAAPARSRLRRLQLERRRPDRRRHDRDRLRPPRSLIEGALVAAAGRTLRVALRRHRHDGAAAATSSWPTHATLENAGTFRRQRRRANVVTGFFDASRPGWSTTPAPSARAAAPARPRSTSRSTTTARWRRARAR